MVGAILTVNPKSDLLIPRSTSTHICGHETKLLTNQFSVCNSFWFITGTFLRQGSGLNPKVTVVN